MTSTELSAAAQSRNGFLGQLFLGHFRWDLISDFPRQSREDESVGDDVIAEIRAMLRAHVDPERVEASGALPDDYVLRLREHRLLNLQLPAQLGGRGLSFVNVMRVIGAAMEWCIPAGYVLALQNGFGAAGVLPTIPPGPTRAYVERHLARGCVSGWADTEPSGAGNTHTTTSARRTAKGAYELSGRKIFILNGPIADFLIVSATLETEVAKETRIFFVDTTLPGFRVGMQHELMGLRGLPISELELDRVVVPAEAMLDTPDTHWRDTPLLEPISSLARMYAIVATSIAVSRKCVAWSEEFVARRAVDQQELASHEAIRHLLASNAAEVFAMESVATAAILGLDHGNLASRWFEQVAAKNLASLGCWRVLDRTMSLMSAEGYETAESKARRGIAPVPLERAMRDARAFRIAGGVDFLIDYYAVREGLLAVYDRETQSRISDSQVHDARLSKRNSKHLERACSHVAELASIAASIRAEYPDPSVLHRRQRILIGMGEISRELFAIAVTLARAASADRDKQREYQALADVYCSNALPRVLLGFSKLSDDQDSELDRSIDACLSPMTRTTQV